MKNKNRLLLIGLITPLVVLLSGCVPVDKNGNPHGWIYEHLVIPTQHIITWIADLFGNNPARYGFALIIITIIVRVAIMPMMLNQAKKSTVQQEKMAALKPQLEIIQKRQKEATTQEEKAQASQQMMAIYSENGVSMMGGIGCLPLLIQMPIFTALYAAIRYNPEISASSFLGLNLGKTSILLTVVVFLIYMAQAYLSMVNVPKEQVKQMRTMMLMSPLMITFFTFSSPGGLALYWVVGGLFSLIQTAITNLIHKPRIKKQVAEELAKNPIKQVIKEEPKEVNPKAKTHSKDAHNVERRKNRPDQGGRNAGKQNRPTKK